MIIRKPNGELDEFSVVQNLVGGSLTGSRVNGKSNFTFHDGQTPPTEAEIDAEIIRLEKEFTALQYQRDRQYPSIGDQLDMQFWDSKNGTTTWQDAVAKVKSDNPK
tara:strand:- start:1445 stop:1762 length:318 start_codon:yes stop_codon:yes gene_type:complete